MIKAVLTNGRRRVLLLGLSGENMARLMADEPIPLDAAQLGLPAQPIVIVGGRTEEDIKAHVLKVGGQLSDVAVSVPGDDQPPPRRPNPNDYAAAAAAVVDLAPDGTPASALAEVALNAAYAARHNRWAHGLSYTCPRCLATSYHPQDVENGYCGACHAFTAPPRG